MKKGQKIIRPKVILRIISDTFRYVPTEWANKKVAKLEMQSQLASWLECGTGDVVTVWIDEDRYEVRKKIIVRRVRT